MSEVKEKLADIRDKKKQLDKLFRQIAPQDERDAQRERMLKKRAVQCDVLIPAVADPGRREASEADVLLWLKTYAPDQFYNDFTADQAEMVAAVLHCIEHGGFQAIAAPRGGGKTSLTTYVILYAMLTGRVRFTLIVAATNQMALRILRNMKAALRNNDLLAADYPEVCSIVRYVGAAPARANGATVNGGFEVDMVWKEDHIILPTVNGSKASGAIVCVSGIEGNNIRGLNINGLRPDLVLWDDVDTRESASSLDQTEKRELTIEQDCCGLGGPGKKFGGVMLCTILNRQCLAYKYTDPKIKPAYNGKRYRLIDKMPDREDLWQEYVNLRLANMESGDPNGRAAHAFYLERREAMEAGAVLTNPFAHNPSLLPDGTRCQESSLQYCYDIIARASTAGKDGWRHFCAEYQSDPPADDGPQTIGITASLVASRTNGLPQRVVPINTRYITVGCDVGKYSCHWVAVAWLDGAVGLVIDHGVAEVKGTKADSDQIAVERAILNALHEWRESLLAMPFRDTEGNVRQISLAPVDSGDFTSAVYQFMREVGGLPFVASKGDGTFRPGSQSIDRHVGDHFYIANQKTDGIWLYFWDTNHWKKQVQERFITPTFNADRTFRPGSLSLFQPKESRQHHTLSHHTVAEEWREEFIEGKGFKRGFFQVNRNNHFLDALAYAVAASEVSGIRLLGQAPTPPRRPQPAPVSTLDMGTPFLASER